MTLLLALRRVVGIVASAVTEWMIVNWIPYISEGDMGTM